MNKSEIPPLNTENYETLAHVYADLKINEPVFATTHGVNNLKFKFRPITSNISFLKKNKSLNSFNKKDLY
jgi:hypothetical protein